MADKSRKKLLHFEGLYGDLGSRRREEYIFLELIKTRSEIFDWTIKPHLHPQLYQVFCIESGEVQLETSRNVISLKTPAIVVIPPGTLHGLQYNPVVKGYILTLSDSVFESLFKEAASLLLHFDSLKSISFSGRKKEFNELMELITKLDAELFHESTGKKLMVKSLLSQFFTGLVRFNETNNQGEFSDTNKTLGHYRKFLQLVKKSDLPMRIPDYAKEIGISPVHLNRICNEACGKSALLIIQEHLVEQSKNYLAHSSYSISEIAYLLNFAYPNYFARLFKKLNGISPKQYRNSKR